MWTSLGAVTEPAGPRAASGRFWAVTLVAAVGLFLLGFLIGTVRTSPLFGAEPGCAADGSGRGEGRERKWGEALCN